MAVIRTTSDARRDIDSITLQIAHDSVTNALRWYDELDEFFKRIARSPGMGTLRDSFQKGLRSVPFGNYLVFFQKIPGGIRIIRVIHGAQRWERILRKNEES